MSPPVAAAAPFDTGLVPRTPFVRRHDLDLLRGVMLVLMMITHLPTTLGARIGQPFGFVSAAEGFVFLSAFLAGSVYDRVAREHGAAAMRRALLSRALKVYLVHAGLLVFLFLVLVPMAKSHGAHAITDLASFYVHDPRQALAGGLLLVYNPPLLDILPMYVIFLAASAWVLDFACRRGFALPLAASGALWLFAQFGGGRMAYAWVAGTLGLHGAYAQTGAFSLFAWQFLWLAGLAAGARARVDPPPAATSPADRPSLLWPAIVVAGVLFGWRHVVGQTPFDGHAAWNVLFDKWQLGPLRLLNFAVLAVLAVHGRFVLAAWSRHSPVATLGRASLAVFSAHIVLCLCVLATLGDDAAAHSGALEATLLAGSLAALYVVARVALLLTKAREAPAAPDPRVAAGLAAISDTAR